MQPPFGMFDFTGAIFCIDGCRVELQAVNKFKTYHLAVRSALSRTTTGLIRYHFRPVARGIS